jgi:hypothetical protein
MTIASPQRASDESTTPFMKQEPKTMVLKTTSPVSRKIRKEEKPFAPSFEVLLGLKDAGVLLSRLT